MCVGGGGGGGGCAARLSPFVIFSLLSRPRAGLVTACEVFFRVGNQYTLNVRNNNNKTFWGILRRSRYVLILL